MNQYRKQNLVERGGGREHTIASAVQLAHLKQYRVQSAKKKGPTLFNGDNYCLTRVPYTFCIFPFFFIFSLAIETVNTFPARGLIITRPGGGGGADNAPGTSAPVRATNTKVGGR